MKKFTVLRSHIKGLASEIQLNNKNFHKIKHNPCRASNWQMDMNSIRKVARLQLLAYSFLRKKDYKDVERSCHTLPDPVALLKLINLYKEQYRDFLLNDVKSWLGMKVVVLEKVS